MNKKKNAMVPKNRFTEFLLYTTPGGKVKVEIFLRDETIWLTQEKIALLFGVQRPAVTKHLKNIFESGELAEYSVNSILEHTAPDGKTYKTKFYNLDALCNSMKREFWIIRGKSVLRWPEPLLKPNLKNTASSGTGTMKAILTKSSNSSEANHETHKRPAQKRTAQRKAP